MKIVTVPPVVEAPQPPFQDRKQIKPWSFSDFIREVVENTTSFGKSPKNIRKMDRILAAVESLDGKPTVAFESEDFDALKDALDQFNWHPVIARKFIPFYDAIEKADSTDKK